MITWDIAPSQIARNLIAYQQKVELEVVALASLIAKELESEAKANAPWQDRTGEARKALTGSVSHDAANALITIYLSHGPDIDYGIFLEMANGQRFAVILPMIQRMFPEIERRLKTRLSYGGIIHK